MPKKRKKRRLGIGPTTNYTEYMKRYMRVYRKEQRRRKK